MIQLASTCEAMGIPKDTVKTLKRWDRVHMIKELAGVAVSFPAATDWLPNCGGGSLVCRRKG